MGNILIGYEYGSGMGHLARMLPIARILSDRNHQVALFVRNPQECAQIFIKEKFPILPVMNISANIPELRMQPQYNSYSDFMAIAGCYYADYLFTATLSWKTVFDLYKPDLIICDHSPNCCLAAPDGGLAYIILHRFWDVFVGTLFFNRRGLPGV